MQNIAHILLKGIIFIRAVSKLNMHIQPEGNIAHEISFVVLGFDISKSKQL